MKRYLIEFSYKYSDSPLVFNEEKQYFSKSKKDAVTTLKTQLNQETFKFLSVLYIESFTLLL